MAEKLNIDQIRADFPVLHQQVNKAPLIYFDNAATTQKPKAVIDALSAYYEQDNANIHRGIHTLAERATTAYELTRKKLSSFLNSFSPSLPNQAQHSLLFLSASILNATLLVHPQT